MDYLYRSVLDGASAQFAAPLYPPSTPSNAPLDRSNPTAHDLTKEYEHVAGVTCRLQDELAELNERFARAASPSTRSPYSPPTFRPSRLPSLGPFTNDITGSLLDRLEDAPGADGPPFHPPSPSPLSLSVPTTSSWADITRGVSLAPSSPAPLLAKRLWSPGPHQEKI